MDAARRIVLVDLGVGLAALISGLLYAGPGALDAWWVGALVAVATAVLAWSEEHDVVGGWATIGLVLAFGLTFLVVGLTFGSAVVEDVALPAALVGLGAGLVPYRLYFGLVRPVPERRLRRVREGVV